MARRRAWGSLVRRELGDDVRWYARIRVEGTRTHRLLLLEDGRTPCETLAEAEEAIERLRARQSAADGALSGETASLAAWLDAEYDAILRSRLTPHAADQHVAYLVRFDAWLQDRCGGTAEVPVTMDAVDRAAAERFLADFLAGRMPAVRGTRKRTRAYKPSYARRYVNVLRAAWNDALTRQLVEANPWSKLRLPRIETRQVPWVAPADLARLCAEVSDFERPLVRLLAETGLRVSEALALRREDLVLDAAVPVLHVRGGKTPAARRTVPLAPATVTLLRGLPRRRDRRVLAPRLSQLTLREVKRACRHLRLPPVTLHQLRHVYASHLVVAGTPPTVVASLLGHSDGGVLVLRLYGRWYPPDAQAQAVRALSAFRATPAPESASRATAARPSGRGAAPSAARPGPSASRR